MPKSKNKRKSGKHKKRRKSSERPSSSVSQAPVATPPKKKRSFREALFAEEGAGLYRFALYFPLLIGAWCAAGIVLSDVLIFALITLSIALTHFYSVSKAREDIPFVGNLLLLLQAAEVVLVITAYHLTKHPGLVSALAVVAALAIAEEHLDLKRPRGVLLLAFSNTLRACLYAVLGVLSQVHSLGLETYLIYALYGFPVACVLFAYLVLKHADVFLNAGWKVKKEVTKKNGSTILRPGSLSQLYAFALMIGPAVPCAAVPFGLVPSSFLVLALSFLVLPKLAEAQFNESSARELIVLQTILSAAGVALLSLLAGILARYGVFS